MYVGHNCIASDELPYINQWIQEGNADFCELMVDNVAHLSAHALSKALGHHPISLHIVSSQFLEKNEKELKALSDQLRPWIKTFQPLYVSDHLVRFKTDEGQCLPFVTEYDYEKYAASMKTRISMWQMMLDTSLLFENHASITSIGKSQVAFFDAMIQETGAGLLFDFSNAYIAEINHIEKMSAWDHLIKQCKHFHVGGFRIEKTSQLAIDTHDVSVADEVLHKMKAHYHDVLSRHATLTVEFEVNTDPRIKKNEIIKIKKYFQK